MGDRDNSPERRSGCGLLNAVFGRRGLWPRRATSTGSLPTSNSSTNKAPSTPNSKRRRGGSDEAAFLENSSVKSEPSSHKPQDRIIERPGPNHQPKTPPMYQAPPSRQQQQQQQQTRSVGPPQQGYDYGQAGRRVPQGTGISGELEVMIADHQRSKGAGSLVRASSSNVMLFGNLGNIRQPGGTAGSYQNNVLDYLPKTAREEPLSQNGMYPNSVAGNVVKKSNDVSSKPVSLCRAISTRMDPEQLKILGNEDYKNGRFAEALALYDAAISIDPNKASYRSNKSAALSALGRLLEAVFECREAIRIEPYYQRAHNRLATLYLRLGEADKALHHYKQAGSEADPEILNKAKNVQAHLHKCTEAKRQRDWNALIKETNLVMSAGADSAPQIYSLKAEALLKLRRHQEAVEVLDNGPNFGVDDCTRFFGPIGNASVLVTRALVDMAAGRFDEAVGAAQQAARLDSNNKEASIVARRTRAVAVSRSKGNELFKTARYSEACVAYGEGLDVDPYNAVLLCNRALCLSKLGQLEKAIDDCTAALNVRPSYTKARLRRADFNAKMGRWDASIQDYEILKRENPEDEDVMQGLKDVQANLRKHRGESVEDEEYTKDNKGGHTAGVVNISSTHRFMEVVSSPGISVVYFCNMPGDIKIMQCMEQLSNSYQSVNFLKVEVEENQSLAKSEGVSSLPTLRIYKDGSKAEDIPDGNHDLLGSCMEEYMD